MKIIYLDQNKWIDLARAYHGKDSEPSFVAALNFLQTAVESGDVILPLSAIHYMELSRITNTGRRARLGEVMWELSQGNTLASTSAILIRELEVALSRRFRHVAPGPFTLLSKGVGHAFGLPQPRYRLPAELRSKMPSERIRTLEAVAQLTLEKAALTGVDPDGKPAAPFLHKAHKENFKDHLERLPSTAAQLPREQWDDLLCAVSLMDIHEPLISVLGHHKLVLGDLLNLGKTEITQFIEELPSRLVDLHLHRQILRNPALKPKLSDLEDWAGLGPAAAYSDFLVCEKHFADQLARDGFRPAATVITDVRDLPRHLSS